MSQNTAVKEQSPYAEGIKQQFIQDYGLAYQSFGLPRLMGYIVGLLLFHDEPLSLTQVTDELHVSKGPVSQIMRRLRDHGQVERVWVPGSRQDYYRAVPDIFEKAFRNHAKLLAGNLHLAQRFQALIEETDEELPEVFSQKIDEMQRFNDLMQKHFGAFMQEWEQSKKNDS